MCGGKRALEVACWGLCLLPQGIPFYTRFGCKEKEHGAVSWASALAHAQASSWIWRCQTSCGAGVGTSDVAVPQEPGKKRV